MTLVKINNTASHPLNPLAEKFNQLTQKIDELKTRISAKEAEMDKCLEQWRNSGINDFIKVQQFQFEYVSLLFDFHESGKIKSRTDRDILIQMIIMQMTLMDHNNQIYKLEEYEQFREKVLKSKGFEIDSDLIEEQASLFEEFLNGMGLETDFDINKWVRDGANPDDIPDDFKEQIRLKQEEEKNRKSKKKNKKINSKKPSIKELVTKNLSDLYRQLARIFHPDLETDPDQKILKEQLMTDLNLAYEAKNFHLMLQMEIKWLENSSEKFDKMSEDKLQVYIESLKEQIKILHSDLDQVPHQRKYALLHELATPHVCYSLNVYKKIIKEFHIEGEEVTKSIQLLKKNGIKELKSVIQEFKDFEKMLF